MRFKLIKKDKIRRIYVKKQEKKNILYKYILNDVNNEQNKKIKILNHYKFLKKFRLNWSSSRVVNTCIQTGHTRWILRRFRLSRMSFKIMAEQGLFNGVRIASW